MLRLHWNAKYGLIPACENYKVFIKIFTPEGLIKMKYNKKIYEKVFENLNDGLYFVDTKRVITYWNKAAQKITGFSAHEVIGRPCFQNILTHVDEEGRSLCAGLCPLMITLTDGNSREAEAFLHHKDGHRVPVLIRVSAIMDSKSRIIGGIELFTDISRYSDDIARIKELEKLALLDSLTGLANRTYIEREIDIRFEEKKRFGLPFGILFMDIDHFKKFNDRYGHETGDAVLKFVARTFMANTRPFDLYGRWGGEEFVGIVRNVNLKDLERMGNRVRALIESAYLYKENEKHHVTVSIGATIAREGDTMESLIKRADALMYQSKKSGRNCLTAE